MVELLAQQLPLELLALVGVQSALLLLPLLLALVPLVLVVLVVALFPASQHCLAGFHRTKLFVLGALVLDVVLELGGSSQQGQLQLMMLAVATTSRAAVEAVAAAVQAAVGVEVGRALKQAPHHHHQGQLSPDAGAV